MLREAAKKTCRLEKGGGRSQEGQVLLIATQPSLLVVDLVMEVTFGTRNKRVAQSGCKTTPAPFGFPTDS